MRQVLYAKPSVGPLEIEYVLDAVTHGWGTHCYDYLIRLRTEFAAYQGVGHAWPTASCTGALHIGLAALGVGRGDEVIVPDATWVATAAPVTYLGATPVFVDVLEDSWCIDPKAIEAAITDRTKAIIVVHLYGNLADMDAIMAIARRHDIGVIEDAAEALGSTYHGQRAGSIADLGTFSFHGAKTMTTGEGGMLITNRADLAERITVLENHGRDPKVPKMFWCEDVGLKYRMSNLQAALGCAQMQRIDELVDKKRQVYAWYREAARDIDDLAWNPEPEGTWNSFWMPTIVLGPSHRVAKDDVIERLNEIGVGARTFFYPNTAFPMFVRERDNPVSYRLSERGLNLPSYFDLTRDDVDYVVDALRDILSDRSATGSSP